MHNGDLLDGLSTGSSVVVVTRRPAAGRLGVVLFLPPCSVLRCFGFWRGFGVVVSVVLREWWWCGVDDPSVANENRVHDGPRERKMLCYATVMWRVVLYGIIRTLFCSRNTCRKCIGWCTVSCNTRRPLFSCGPASGWLKRKHTRRKHLRHNGMKRVHDNCRKNLSWVYVTGNHDAWLSSRKCFPPRDG